MNIWDKLREPQNLKFLTSLGYFTKDEAIKVDKFSRADLSNNVPSVILSFNKGISINDFKPFNDSLSDLFIVSSSLSDIHEIKVYYINGNRELKDGTVTLNGTSNVNLNTTFGETIHCIWRMENLTDTDNVGTINIVDGSDNIYCNMPITSGVVANNSLTGVFSIPSGYIGLMLDASLIHDKGADSKGAIFTRSQGKVFRYRKALAGFENQSKYDNVFLTIDENTDILPVAVAQTGGIVYLDYTVVLIKKELIGNYND